MTKETLEHLSSLMDGELSPEAGRFLSRRMATDESLGGTWQRYHLIRDCLRRPGEDAAFADLQLDLDALDAHEGHGTGMSRSWLRPAGGLAIAASVALAAVLVTFNLGQGPANQPAQPFARPNTLLAVPPSQAASFNGGSVNTQQRLNRYLIRHNQVAGAVGQQGFVSYVPIVTSAPVQVMEPTPEANAADAAEETSSAER